MEKRIRTLSPHSYTTRQHYLQHPQLAHQLTPPMPVPRKSSCLSCSTPLTLRLSSPSSHSFTPLVITPTQSCFHFGFQLSIDAPHGLLSQRLPQLDNAFLETSVNLPYAYHDANLRGFVCVVLQNLTSDSRLFLSLYFDRQRYTLHLPSTSCLTAPNGAATMPLHRVGAPCSSDVRGPVAQLGERYNRTVEARGSSPLRSTNQRSPRRRAFFWSVAAALYNRAAWTDTITKVRQFPCA